MKFHFFRHSIVFAAVFLFSPANAQTVLIHNLPPAAPLTGYEAIPADQGTCSTCTVKTTPFQLAQYVLSQPFAVNASNITTGTLPCAQLPSFTGAITTTGCAATIGVGAISLSSLAAQAANTVLATGTSAGSPSSYSSLPSGIPTYGFDTPIKEGASGNGATNDTTAVQTCASTGACFLPCNTTFLVSTSIFVPNQGTFIGCGPTSIVSGNSVTGGVIQVSTFSGAAASNLNIGNFGITGTATYGLATYNNTGGSRIHDIQILPGATFTDDFYFAISFGNIYENLSVNGIFTTANASFYFDGAFSANLVNNLYTNTGNIGAATYSFYMQNDNGSGPLYANTFNNLTAQGSRYGLYIGGGTANTTVNGYYAENVVEDLAMGNAGTGQIAQNITINGANLGGPVSTQAGYSSRNSLVDCSYAFGVTMTGVYFNGSYLVGSAAPLTFSGGGSPTTVAKAIAYVNAAGVIRAVYLTNPGAGYTSTPSVSIGGAGSSGSVTVNGISGGAVTGITLAAGGSGYTQTALMPITYTNCQKAVIVSPSISNGVQYAPISSLYPWVVRSSTAGSTSGINVRDDTAWDYASWYSADATMQKADTGGYLHYVTWLNSSGATVVTPYIPPVFP